MPRSAKRRPYALPRHPLPRPLGLALGALAVLVAALLHAPGWAAAERLKALRPGEEVRVLGCLSVAVLDFTDRWGPLDPADWVTVRIANDCDEPVRHMLVDLLLRDAAGKTYGAPVWLLEQGEILWPGQVKTERFPVPDAADHLPRHWAVRVRALQRPSDFRRKPPAPATVAPATRVPVPPAASTARIATRKAAPPAPVAKPARTPPPPATRKAAKPAPGTQASPRAASKPKATAGAEPSAKPWWKR